MTNTTREIIENDIRAAFDNAVLIGADPAAVLAILQQMVEDEARYQAEMQAHALEAATADTQTIKAPHFDTVATFAQDGERYWSKSHLPEWDYLGQWSSTCGGRSCGLRVRRVGPRTWEANASRKGIKGTATGRTRDEAGWSAMLAGQQV